MKQTLNIDSEKLAKLIAAAIYAKEVINILWVSHHANRADHAIEAIDKAIAEITNECP